MDPSLLIAIVAGVVILLVLVLLAVLVARRRRRLRERFGTEYDRAAQDRSKLAADRELEQREKRHAQLDIRPLSPAAKQHYSEGWANVQQEFVDRPTTAVVEADRLVTSLMAERGYPTEGFEQQLADLSVEHSRTLEHYRTAHGIMLRHQHGEAAAAVPATEDLRAAMLHYRTLFEDLLTDEEPQDRGMVQTNATARQEPPTEPVPAQPTTRQPPQQGTPQRPPQPPPQQYPPQQAQPQQPPVQQPPPGQHPPTMPPRPASPGH